MPSAPVPATFVLHVDGGESYLVCSGSRLTIGPRGSRRTVDIPLMADASTAAVTIERSDEDFFLSAPDGVTLNGRQVSRGLLADGDRVEMTPRARLRFARPNRASTSAVLSLDGLRIVGTDARKIVLLDREIIIGASGIAAAPGMGGQMAVGAGHIRAERLARPVVLCRRHGQLMLMHGDQPPRPLSLNQPVKLAGVSLCISEVSWR